MFAISGTGAGAATGGITLEHSNAGPNRGYVYYNGQPICGENPNFWTIHNANVVCKMLGYTNATDHDCDTCGLSEKYGPCPPAGLQFGVSGFKCNGTETHILQCPHDSSVPAGCGDSGKTNQAHDNVMVLCA